MFLPTWSLTKQTTDKIDINIEKNKKIKIQYTSKIKKMKKEKKF